MREAYYSRFIPENVAPRNAKNFIVRHNGEPLVKVALGNFAQPDEIKRYEFMAISDVHLTYDTANSDFQRALTYAENSDCLFTCISGDLTSTGTESELSTFKTIVNAYSPHKPVYAITGNHENYSTVSNNYLQNYTGKPLYYSFSQGDDVYIMLGHYGGYAGDGIGWVAGEQFSSEELRWAYETLEINRNKRCFVFIHVFPWGGSGNANGLYATNNWSSTKGDVFEDLMRHYKNTVLFHGHSHLRFGLQNRDKTANYSAARGYRSIHIPSLSVPRDLVDGTLTGIYSESEGYIVDVYDDYIILNGRDFIDNDADGHILPIATYKIDTHLVEIPANTFVDSTGTITTA